MNAWRGRVGAGRGGRLASAMVAAIGLVTPALVAIAGGAPAGAVTGTYVSPATPALSNTTAGAVSQYTVAFRTSSSGSLPSNATITFTAPSGTSFPSSSCSLLGGCPGYSITADLGSPSINSVTTSHATGSATNNQVVIQVSPGVLQPNISGNVTVTISSVANPTVASSSYVLEEFTSVDTNQVASPQYSINPGPRAKILATRGTPQTAALGTFFQSPLVATVQDGFNNPVSGETVVFTIGHTAGGASATFTNGTATENPSSGADGNAVTSIPKANGIAGGPYSVSAVDGNLSATFFLNNGTGQVIPGAAHLSLPGPGSPTQAKAASVTYTAPFQTVSPIPPGGTVTVAVPAGTTLPAANSGRYSATAGGAQVPVSSVSLDATGTQATLTLGNPDPIGSQTPVVVTIGGVTNPPTAGTYTLSEQTSTDTTPAASPSFPITPAAPTHLAVAFGDNQVAKPGAAFTIPLGVTAVDLYGNPVPGVSVTFTVVPASGAGATFSSGSSQTVPTDSTGLATTGPLTANTTTGTYTATAAATGLPPQTFHLSNAPAVTPGTATVKESGGLPAVVGSTNATYTVPFTTSTALSSGCPNSCIITLVAPNGTAFPSAKGSYGVAANNSHSATVGAVFVSEAAGYGSTTTSDSTNQVNIQLSSSTIAAGDLVTVTVTGVTNPTVAGSAYRIEESTSTDGQPVATPAYSIGADQPQNLSVVSGSPQTQEAGQTYSAPLEVALTDKFGNPVPTTQVTFTPPASGPTVTVCPGPSPVNPCTAATDANGDASVTAIAGSAPGALQVDAKVGTVHTKLNLTNVAGAVSTLTVVSGDNQSAMVTTQFPSQLVVKAADAAGNPVPGVAVVFAAPASGIGATFATCESVDPATRCTVLTDGAGDATSAPVTANSAAGGSYAVNVTSESAATAFHLTNTVGVPTEVFVDGGDQQQTLVLSQFADPLVVTITDSSGNPVPGVAVTFATPASGANATFDPCEGGNPTPNQCVVTTDTLGNASSSSLTAGPDPGTYGVVVSVGGSGVEALTLTNLQSGYYLVASDGGVFTFGGAPFYGSTGAQHLNAPIVGMSPAAGDGYYLVASDGGIFTFGPGAAFYGSTGAQHLNAPVVGMAVDPQTGGYWLVASDGGVFSFNAPFWGSMGAKRLNSPIVGIAATPDGGYYLVASDGGIFSFGPGATFYGSAGGAPLNAPIVGMAIAPGGGYWLVASDGGIFSFGPGAGFFGSAADHPLNRPIVGMAVDPASGGYWLVASDGGIFSFGAPFYGSTGAIHLNRPIVGMSASA